MEAAETLKAQHNINCEVVNLRSLRPLDVDAIIKSVKKTNHLVSVETGWPQCGIGSEIIAQVMESEAFDYLDAPIKRITTSDAPAPYSPVLLEDWLPNSKDLIKAVHEVLYR